MLQKLMKRVFMAQNPPFISLAKEFTNLLQAFKYSVLYVRMPSDDVKNEKNE